MTTKLFSSVPQESGWDLSEFRLRCCSAGSRLGDCVPIFGGWTCREIADWRLISRERPDLAEASTPEGQ